MSLERCLREVGRWRRKSLTDIWLLSNIISFDGQLTAVFALGPQVEKKKKRNFFMKRTLNQCISSEIQQQENCDANITPLQCWVRMKFLQSWWLKIENVRHKAEKLSCDQDVLCQVSGDLTTVIIGFQGSYTLFQTHIFWFLHQFLWPFLTTKKSLNWFEIIWVNTRHILPVRNGPDYWSSTAEHFTEAAWNESLKQ